MRPMLAFIFAVTLAACGEESSKELAVGEVAPAFTVTTTDGNEVSLDKLKGKVVLVNFFATWCGPCLAELPLVETDIWQKFKDRGLVLVVIGREHSKEELVKFKTDNRFTMPFAPDPNREVFSKYAAKSIPRNYLVGADGRIAFQSIGFEKGEFSTLVQKIEQELGK